MSPDVVNAGSSSVRGKMGKATDGWQENRGELGDGGAKKLLTGNWELGAGPKFVTKFMNLFNTCSWHNSSAASTE